MIKKTIHFEEETMIKIDKACRVYGMNASTFIRFATLNELDNMEDRLKDE